MKHRNSKLLAALLACAASAGVMAQSNAPTFKINVIGTIAPGSCTPTTGDLTFDMKEINTKTLNNDKPTMLDMITKSVKITCSADTSIALSAQATQSASSAYTTNMENHTTAKTYTSANALYDLVNAADTNSRVGVFAMQFRNFTYTGGGKGSTPSTALIIKSEDRNTWAYLANTNDWDAAQLKKNGSNLISFADKGANTVPVLASVYEGQLIVAPMLLPKKDLILTGDLKFTGGAVITLNYI